MRWYISDEEDDITFWQAQREVQYAICYLSKLSEQALGCRSVELDWCVIVQKVKDSLTHQEITELA